MWALSGDGMWVLLTAWDVLGAVVGVYAGLVGVLLLVATLEGPGSRR